MIIQSFKKGQLYVNYLGPFSALLGNLIATPILISNLGLKEWSLFALINILFPLIYFVLFGSSEIVRRLMINIFLGNTKTNETIKIFYKYEQKILVRFIFGVLILSTTLIIFNSNNYSLFEGIEYTFFFLAVAVLINIFGFYYAELLNGLKEHYKLHSLAFIITVCKWSTIIYLSFSSKININILILAVIFFTCLLLVIQRIFISNIFKKKVNQLTNKNSENISEFNENNFGSIIFLFLLTQQFYKILTFGVLDPISLSYFGIAFMISSAIPLTISPIIVYLTPEIYEMAEVNSPNRKKYFFRLISVQFIILLILLTIVNLYLKKILSIWIGNSINVLEVSSFLMPLSIIAFSISLINTFKILFIAENKIILMKKPLISVFSIFLILTIGVYIEFLTIDNYLYCYSILMFLLVIYFHYIFYRKFT